MKRIICIILSILMVLSIFGCKSKKEYEKGVIAASETETDTSEKAGDTPEETLNDNEENIGETITTDVKTEQNTDVLEESETQADASSEAMPEQTPVSSVDNNINTEKNDAQITEQPHEYDADITVVPTIGTLEEHKNLSSDIFIGKIIEITDYYGQCDFPLFMGFEQGVKLCKVLVEKVYRGTSVSNGATIYLYKSSFQHPAVSTEPYEIGKTYIISATLQPLYGEPVLVDNGFLSAEIGDDGKLIGKTTSAKKAVSYRETLDKFNSDEAVKENCMSEFKDFSNIFTKYIKTDKTETELIADIKKAIIADSDFKMNLEKADEIK